MSEDRDIQRGSFEIDSTASSDPQSRVLLRASGDLDLFSVEELLGVLASDEVRGRDVVIDLRELDFIDSSGLGAVHRAYRAAKTEGRDFSVIIAGARSVERLFELSALAGVIPVTEPDGDPVAGKTA